MVKQAPGTHSPGEAHSRHLSAWKPCAITHLRDALQIQASPKPRWYPGPGHEMLQNQIDLANLSQNTPKYPFSREMDSCDSGRRAKGKSEEGSVVVHGATSVPRGWCKQWDHPVLRWLFQQPSRCLDSPGTAETFPGPIPKSRPVPQRGTQLQPRHLRSARLALPQHRAPRRGAPIGPEGDPGEQLAPSAPAHHPPAVLGQDFTPSSRAGLPRPRGQERHGRGGKPSASRHCHLIPC